MRIRILPEAEQDLLEGIYFYEAQSLGLGCRFLDSISADIESLHQYAGIHIRERGYFRMLAHRFPFAIFYRIAQDEIRIHAVLDCRRNPAWIRNRLSQ
jgi:hypothetical protein